ncbi:preprotein translocase subunit SecG [Kitasatospora sp. NPDC086791]|uniref:preprotein translocase subunit SecG n=1 Tax=Kitasatospora sp. NPDC086791 TaxID=3155178 RepID=UPI00343283DB
MVLVLLIALMVLSLLLVALVLAHKSSGGGVAGMFGGRLQPGDSDSVVVERNLTHLTVAVALAWFGCMVALMVMATAGA